MRLLIFALLFISSAIFVSNLKAEVISVSEVNWEKLNPARGDKSPQAATLYGDRNGSEPTGFLVKFVDGFSSPPHIHNVSYRGVVISGLIHNDDPGAAHMWMPKGSYWTQPKGEVHITAAKGDNNVAYIEIEESPYLVQPLNQAYDSGERPVNIDKSNIVWIDYPYKKLSKTGLHIAYLWGNPNEDDLNGKLLKFPKGFKGNIESPGSVFNAVVIEGQLKYEMETGSKVLPPGSFFNSKKSSKHHVLCDSKEDCVLYLRTKGKFKVIPN